MEWIELGAASAAAVLLLAILGLPPALALRLRGLWLCAAVAPMALTVIAVASFVSPRLGFSWSLWPAIATSLLATVALWAIVQALKSPRLVHDDKLEGRAKASWRQRSMASLPTVVAVLLAASLIGWRFVRAIGSPELFAQEHDNVFHLNAVRHVLEAGDASPNGVVQFSVPGTSSIYPSVWHAFNTLVLPVVDVSVVTASNAAFIVTACLVWPLSVLVLTRAAFGRAPAVTISAGVIGAGVATFPLFLITDIGAYPLVLSTSVLPVAIGSALAVAFTQPSSPSRPVALLLLLGVVPGIVATHPSSLHAMAFLSLPVAIVFVVRWSRSHSRWRIAAFAAFAAFALLVLLLSLEVRPAFQKNPTIESFPEALIAIATLGIAEFPAAPLVALMSVIGAIAAIRSRDARQLSVVGMWIVGLGLYVVAASGDELTRSILTGGWYRDPMRLAALAAVTVVPLAAHGSATVWGWMRSVVGNRAPALVRVLGAFATVGLIVGTQGAAMRTVEEWTAQSFTPAEHADGVRVPLGNDARELFERVPNIVPKGEVIVGDPKDGSSFLYALTGWRVLLPHLLTPRTPEITALLDGLATSTPQGPACVAARDLELRWVLVTRERTPEDLEPGLLGLENSPNVELVDSEGGARLYRITGCGS